jgi:acyl-CoA thioesterase-1
MHAFRFLGASLAAWLMAALPVAAQPATVAQPASCQHAMPAWLTDAALPLSATRARLADRPVLKIIAIGSSSTEGIGASSPATTYPALLQTRLAAELPGVKVKVINRGISGEDVAQNLARFDEDVLTQRPSLVIWQAGANMAMRQADPARFRTLLERGIEVLKAEGIDVILMDSQPSPRVLAAPRNDTFLAMTRDTAQEQEVSLFPRNAMMRAWQAADPAMAAQLIGPDRLHHTDAGYACVAQGLAAMILAGLR